MDERMRELQRRRDENDRRARLCFIAAAAFFLVGMAFVALMAALGL